MRLEDLHQHPDPRIRELDQCAADNWNEHHELELEMSRKTPRPGLTDMDRLRIHNETIRFETTKIAILEQIRQLDPTIPVSSAIETAHDEKRKAEQARKKLLGGF
jgi:hypothetical protein